MTADFGRIEQGANVVMMVLMAVSIFVLRLRLKGRL